MKVTFCTGIRRSGSTWSFNVARLLEKSLANHLGRPFHSIYAEAERLDEILADDREGFLVVKSHRLGEHALRLIREERARNICSIRDPRDTSVSLMKFQDTSLVQAVSVVKRDLELLDCFEEGRDLFVRYEEMIRDPAAMIRSIARHLSISPEDHVIEEVDRLTSVEHSKEVADSLVPGNKRTRVEGSHSRVEGSHWVDRVTLLHTKHIQSGKVGRWKDELSQERRGYLNRELAPWLIALAYETESSLDPWINP